MLAVLTYIIETQRDKVGMDDPDWQPKHVPRVMALQNIDETAMAARIEKYRSPRLRSLGWMPGRKQFAYDASWECLTLAELCVAHGRSVNKYPVAMQLLTSDSHFPLELALHVHGCSACHIYKDDVSWHLRRAVVGKRS